MADKVFIDLKALADMRDRLALAESSERRVAELEERAKTAETELSQTIEAAKVSNDQVRANQDELTNALRLAQTAAWESAKELSETASRLNDSLLEVENLNEQIRRIVESKAWRAVSVYRRAIGRLRS